MEITPPDRGGRSIGIFHGARPGLISRDSTAIEARVTPVSPPKAEKPKRKRGRPKKGEEGLKELRRVERQSGMTLAAMLADLPRNCSMGVKRNAKGQGC